MASVPVNRASPLTSGKSTVVDCEEDHSNYRRRALRHCHAMPPARAVEGLPETAIVGIVVVMCGSRCDGSYPCGRAPAASAHTVPGGQPCSA